MAAPSGEEDSDLDLEDLYKSFKAPQVDSKGRVAVLLPLWTARPPLFSPCIGPVCRLQSREGIKSSGVRLSQELDVLERSGGLPPDRAAAARSAHQQLQRGVLQAIADLAALQRHVSLLLARLQQVRAQQEVAQQGAAKPSHVLDRFREDGQHARQEVRGWLGAKGGGQQEESAASDGGPLPCLLEVWFASAPSPKTETICRPQTPPTARMPRSARRTRSSSASPC